MSETDPKASCAEHPERASVGDCAHCGKPICEACRVEVVATEQSFCSEWCRDAVSAESGQAAVSNATLKAGLKQPIIGGWKLWLQSMSRILAHVFPVAAFLGFNVAVVNRIRAGLPSPAADAPVFLALALVAVLCVFFGVALVGVILSGRHAGVVVGAPLATAARRFIPWFVTWILMIGVTFAGYIALILPGIYLYLRLFWADEFALTHNKGPIEALRSSWDLTRGKAGEIFGFQFMLGIAQNAVTLPGFMLMVFLLGGLEKFGVTGPEEFSGIEVFVLVLIGLVVYGAMHGPEIVQFYGMRAAKADLERFIDPALRQRSSARANCSSSERP